MKTMGNEQFQDVSVLKTLVRLRSEGLLHPDDQQALIACLRTPWGRKAAHDMLSDNREAFAAARSILRQFAIAV